MSDNKKEINIDDLVIQNIMKTPDGRDYMWKRLQATGVFETMFDKDPILNAYNAGRREIGVTLNRDIKDAAPGDYIKMLTENI